VTEIDRLLERYPAARIKDALWPELSPERQRRIEEVVAARLSGLTVVIENLHDPHNGAAALRSIEGFGLCELHVVEATERFDFSPKVSQGCEKWVAIRRYPDFAACAATLHGRGFRLLAAVPDAPDPIDDIDLSVPTALVVGNEHAGLTDGALDACDGAYRIDMPGMTRSFNLSVSVALSVFACARRRRQGCGGGDLDEEGRTRLLARFAALSVDRRAVAAFVERAASPPRG
jgi:tRNA (guanosine-2'-O-)-methyltransferase